MRVIAESLRQDPGRGRQPPAQYALVRTAAVEPELVDQAADAISSVEGVEAIRELRIRWIGHTLRAEADITVDPAIDVATAHDIAHHAEDHLLANVPCLSATTIRISPTGAHPG